MLQIENFQNSDMVPLWLAQATLLSHIVNSFTNNRPEVERSLITRSILNVILAKLELSLRAAASGLSEEEEGPDDEALWNTWIHCEALRRTAYGLWVSSYCPYITPFLKTLTHC